ncbi:hypothetical protein B296_00002078 [Ensete ventricosum]|uniref:Uncharacterized protein n=1 Tax=Ensete ventricosum TaxID=4639 RepID=A0A427AZX7_ENSVE|nr:hypothetical protein B296_00002078 [Ensete ventricosum]
MGEEQHRVVSLCFFYFAYAALPEADLIGREGVRLDFMEAAKVERHDVIGTGEDMYVKRALKGNRKWPPAMARMEFNVCSEAWGKGLLQNCRGNHEMLSLQPKKQEHKEHTHTTRSAEQSKGDGGEGRRREKKQTCWLRPDLSPSTATAGAAATAPPIKKGRGLLRWERAIAKKQPPPWSRIFYMLASTLADSHGGIIIRHTPSVAKSKNGFPISFLDTGTCSFAGARLPSFPPPLSLRGPLVRRLGLRAKQRTNARKIWGRPYRRSDCRECAWDGGTKTAREACAMRRETKSSIGHKVRVFAFVSIPKL